MKLTLSNLHKFEQFMFVKNSPILFTYCGVSEAATFDDCLVLFPIYVYQNQSGKRIFTTEDKEIYVCR